MKETKEKPPTFSYDKLVVGSSLEAFLFAYYNRIPAIWSRNQQPYKFEEWDKDFGLGINKFEKWSEYAFLLSVSGFSPFENKIKTISVIDKNELRVSTEGNKRYTIKFNHLYVFDDHELYGIEAHTGITTNKVKVIDWIRLLEFGQHGIEVIKRKKDLLNKLMFFICGYGTRCVVESYTEADKLDQFPEYLAKINVQKILEEKIEGLSGNQRAEHLDRVVIPLGKNISENTATITFVYSTL